MDGKTHSISPHDLYARLGTEAAPVLVDVRRGIVRYRQRADHRRSPSCSRIPVTLAATCRPVDRSSSTALTDTKSAKA